MVICETFANRLARVPRHQPLSLADIRVRVSAHKHFLLIMVSLGVYPTYLDEDENIERGARHTSPFGDDDDEPEGDFRYGTPNKDDSMDLGLDDIGDGTDPGLEDIEDDDNGEILKLGRSTLVTIPILFSPTSASIAKPSR
jgi:hypothetical protein